MDLLLPLLEKMAITESKKIVMDRISAAHNYRKHSATTEYNDAHSIKAEKATIAVGLYLDVASCKN